MNKQNRNTVLLLAVAITLIAIFTHRFIPEKRFMATPSQTGASYLYSDNLSDGTPAGIWLDEEKRKFRCIYPEIRVSNYYCSFNQMQTPSYTEGTDFSGYDRMEVSISYSGPSPRLRLFLRNFDKRYSTVGDSNTTKYNVLTIPAKNLNRVTSIELRHFKAAEWWLEQYRLPVEESYADIQNVINLGVDFSGPILPGNHDVTVEKIEFVGVWISKENWYLTILCCWLLGMGIYAINQLRLLRAKNSQSLSIISKLNQNNALLKNESDKFRRLSTVDPLTQAYNRFGIDQIMAAILQPSNGHEARDIFYSVILFDLDFFKNVNDTRGHDAGDRVLKGVAELMEKSFRHTDYLGRWGGEEFVIILPGTNKESAFALAEKARKIIGETVFEKDDPLTITASFGIAERIKSEDFSSLLKRVDTALYKSKITGRNRSTMAD